MKRILILFVLFTISQLAYSQCSGDQVEVTFVMYTDAWAYENYWQLVPSGASCGNDVIAEGANLNVGCDGTEADNSPNGYDNNSTYTEGPFCLDFQSYYDLIFVDSYGDGGLIIEVFENGQLTHVYYGGGEGNTWTFQAGVTNIPIYDQPCGAAEVIPNTAGVELTNTNAIAAYGEIAPTNANCAIYGFWCESTSSNSVWAYFVAQEGVNYEITTCGDLEGFDTQMALWHASDCADFSTFELITANDDMFGGCGTSNGYSSLMYSGCLIPGDTYYVQVDGWNGSTGTAQLIVNSYEGDVTLEAIPNNVACPVNKGEIGTGSIFAYVVGDGIVGDISWTSSNGFTGNTLSVFEVPVGTYTLNMTTTCGVVLSTSVEINEPDFWSVFVTPEQPFCDQSGNGQLTAVANGATPPYNYVWVGPNNYISESSIAPGLDAGNYMLTVGDENGCEYTVNYNLQPSNNFIAELGGPITICSNEIYTFTPASNFEYEWFDGSTGASIILDATEWGIGTHSIFATVFTSDGCSDVDTFEFTVDGCVGVQENGAEASLQIYPQPNTGNFTLVLPSSLLDGQITIYDMLGQVVFVKNTKTTGLHQMDLNLADGQYIVNVNNGNRSATLPLVIAH
jgi:hypothetical protein